MSYIREEISVADGEGRIAVLERSKGEFVRPWAILSPDLGDLDRMTPKQLRALGRELIDIGRRAGREYTVSGKPRQATTGEQP
jgi:hypothetical protein